MTITDILNFANKYNLSDEARDELIKMIVLNQTNNNKIWIRRENFYEG